MKDVLDKIEDDGDVDDFGTYDNEDEPGAERRGRGRPRKDGLPPQPKVQKEQAPVISAEQSILHQLMQHVKCKDWYSFKATLAFDARAIDRGHQIRGVLILVKATPIVEQPQQGGTDEQGH